MASVSAALWSIVEPTRGLEPLTLCLQDRCAANCAKSACPGFAPGVVHRTGRPGRQAVAADPDGGRILRPTSIAWSAIWSQGDQFGYSSARGHTRRRGIARFQLSEWIRRGPVTSSSS